MSSDGQPRYGQGDLACDYINATIGFEELSRRTNGWRKACPIGNPQARNLFEVIQHLQHQLDCIRVQAAPFSVL